MVAESRLTDQSGIEKALQSASESLDKKDFEAWEAFGLVKRSVLVRAGEGEDRRFQTDSESGIGFRASRGGRPGFAFTNVLDRDALEACLEWLDRAVEMGAKDAGFRLPARRRRRPVQEAFDPAVETISHEDRETLATEASQAARSAFGEGSWSCAGLYRDSTGMILVRNSLGLETGFRYSRASLHCECYAEVQGSSSSFSAARYGVGPGDLDPLAVGREAARRASHRSGARPLEPGRYGAFLSPAATARLMRLFAPLLSGERAGAGLSPWGELLGEAVGSAAVNIVDDPVLPRGYGSTPYDGEGVRTARLALVESGILRRFAHTTASAARCSTKSTGNAVRGDYASPPELGFHNLHFTGSQKDTGGCLAGLRDGVYVEELWEGEGPGSSPAEAALEGWGYRVVRGEKGQPVKDFRLREPLHRLLFKLSSACSDVVTFPGGLAGVTSLFEDLTFESAG